MTTRGLAHLYVETHNWGKAVAFWQALGYRLEFETGHHSGMLVADNGTSIFVAEQSPEDPVGIDVYLKVDDPSAQLPVSVELVRDWTETHWGTAVATVRDPDGRLVRLEAPLTASSPAP